MPNYSSSGEKEAEKKNQKNPFRNQKKRNKQKKQKIPIKFSHLVAKNLVELPKTGTTIKFETFII